MESFSAIQAHPIQWIQPKANHKEYELRSEELQFAALTFKSAWGSLAFAETAADRWTFKRVGFFNTRVTVRREGEDKEYAVFRPSWTGMQGTLEVAGGRAYQWKSANFWATQYAFSLEGQPVVLFKPGVDHAKITDIFRFQSRVEVDPAAAALPELPLLVCMGWYLMILLMEDAAAAGAASSAAAASS